jgi:hypothetical protein
MFVHGDEIRGVFDFLTFFARLLLPDLCVLVLLELMIAMGG